MWCRCLWSVGGDGGGWRGRERGETTELFQDAPDMQDISHKTRWWTSGGVTTQTGPYQPEYYTRCGDRQARKLRLAVRSAVQFALSAETRQHQRTFIEALNFLQKKNTTPPKVRLRGRSANRIIEPLYEILK